MKGNQTSPEIATANKQMVSGLFLGPGTFWKILWSLSYKSCDCDAVLLCQLVPNVLSVFKWTMKRHKERIMGIRTCDLRCSTIWASARAQNLKNICTDAWPLLMQNIFYWQRCYLSTAVSSVALLFCCLVFLPPITMIQLFSRKKLPAGNQTQDRSQGWFQITQTSAKVVRAWLNLKNCHCDAFLRLRVHFPGDY